MIFTTKTVITFCALGQKKVLNYLNCLGGYYRKPFSATVKSFLKILEDLESSRSQFSKASRIFEKLLMVAENGSFAMTTSEIKIQCPHNLLLPF